KRELKLVLREDTRRHRLGVILLFTLAAHVALAADENKAVVTYSKDVASILYRHCAVCHHPDDLAPMSLMTYKEVRPWAMSIREKVVQRVMPPWHADPKVGEFTNDPRLSEAEIETIRAWVNGGAKEGDPKDVPLAPVFEQGWHIKPDLV